MHLPTKCSILSGTSWIEENITLVKTIWEVVLIPAIKQDKSKSHRITFGVGGEALGGQI
jgi:hypothetical protein